MGSTCGEDKVLGKSALLSYINHMYIQSSPFLQHLSEHSRLQILDIHLSHLHLHRTMKILVPFFPSSLLLLLLLLQRIQGEPFCRVPNRKPLHVLLESRLASNLCRTLHRRTLHSSISILQDSFLFNLIQTCSFTVPIHPIVAFLSSRLTPPSTLPGRRYSSRPSKSSDPTYRHGPVHPSCCSYSTAHEEPSRIFHTQKFVGPRSQVQTQNYGHGTLSTPSLYTPPASFLSPRR
mmetsp:Transcript_10341/g.43079  ORF Transcript_10341/g.43079 Transcript_10341/m.43079 type:complete len:234 (-) Transcript_10341:563-1264(-)